MESSWGARRYGQARVRVRYCRTLVYHLTGEWIFPILRRTTDCYNAATHGLDRTIVGAAAQSQQLVYLLLRNILRLAHHVPANRFIARRRRFGTIVLVVAKLVRHKTAGIDCDPVSYALPGAGAASRTACTMGLGSPNLNNNPTTIKRPSASAWTRCISAGKLTPSIRCSEGE